MIILPNTFNLDYSIKEHYFTQMTKSGILARNENKLVVSRLYLKATSGMSDYGLDELIQKEIKDSFLTEVIMMGCSLFLFQPKIQRIDIFHTINLLLSLLNKPQIHNSNYENINNWINYFASARFGASNRGSCDE